MQQVTRNVRLWIVGAAALAIGLMPQNASANSIRTVLDGRELTFEVQPVVENDRTLVPLRGILEPVGATIGWDDKTQTVTATLNGTEVKAVIGDSNALVNGEAVALEVAPRIVGDRTLIPLRFFAESLGFAVKWDGETRTVFLESGQTRASRDGSTAARTAATVLEVARKQVGAPYAWGGTSPATGFDCSGFIYYLASQVGLDVPRDSYALFSYGMPVKREELRAGDLVFFTTYAEGPSHVGVYDGQGSFIHSQSEDTGVKVTSLSADWWAPRYLGARRILR